MIGERVAADCRLLTTTNFSRIFAECCTDLHGLQAYELKLHIAKYSLPIVILNGVYGMKDLAGTGYDQV